MTKKIYIYQIYFPTSDKCYIGQTDNLQRRMRNHFRSGYAVCKALYKYDDWQVLVLHICNTKDTADRIEIEEIRNHNSVAPNGYNLTHGGDGGDTFSGKHHTDETKDKQRIAQTGRKHSVESILSSVTTKRANGGYEYSEEQIAKMRIANSGKKNGMYGRVHSAESKIKMRITKLKRQAAKLQEDLNREQL